VTATELVDLPNKRGYASTAVIRATLAQVRLVVTRSMREDLAVVLHVVGTTRFYVRVAKRAQLGPARVLPLLRRCRECGGSGEWVLQIECPACRGAGRVRF